MRSEQLEQRSIARAEKIEEILCEFFAERLPGAGRPEGIVALAGAATKFGQRSVHSGFKAIGSLSKEGQAAGVPRRNLLAFPHARD